MIRLTRAFIDSDGGMHATREAAIEVEVRKALRENFTIGTLPGSNTSPGHDYITLDELSSRWQALERALAHATREDTSIERVE